MQTVALREPQLLHLCEVRLECVSGRVGLRLLGRNQRSPKDKLEPDQGLMNKLW